MTKNAALVSHGGSQSCIFIIIKNEKITLAR